MNNDRAGSVLTRLGSAPVRARFVRVTMTTSSDTCDSHGSADLRNCVGYAIEDVGLGTLDARQRFHDLIVRSMCGGDPTDRRRCAPHQTAIYPSSIDPWHRARDRVRGDQDQPGLDTVTRSGFSRGLPMIYPVPLWYSTPENAVNEIRYLRGRGYPIGYVEMGEEVDGQYATPEDYGALYLQWARAIHRSDPSLRLGGPVFMGWNEDPKTWTDARGDTSWLHRFLLYLKSHRAMRELAFMSFEHYPFHGCNSGAVLHRDLLWEPHLMRSMAAIWRADGLPSHIPMFITEANFSADGAPVALQTEGALWMADWIGSAFSAGIKEINYYQYEAEPAHLSRRCDRYAAYSLFITGRDFRILAHSAQFWAAQMLTRYWLQFGDRENALYPVTTDQRAPLPEVSAYAAKRPDGTWSVMLVNKARTARDVRMTSANATTVTPLWQGPITMTVFGRAQYNWDGRSLRRLPSPNRPPRSTTLAGGDHTYLLPPESIVVLRGRPWLTERGRRDAFLICYPGRRGIGFARDG
ncbi:MAG: hypothetical protein JO043_08900 [Candidatus Eremiobacteraeota bacterium]|nr:hypothetical protein [Candidatus Eremiobacteraeota bacterium]